MNLMIKRLSALFDTDYFTVAATAGLAAGIVRRAAGGPCASSAKLATRVYGGVSGGISGRRRRRRSRWRFSRSARRERRFRARPRRRVSTIGARGLEIEEAKFEACDARATRHQPHRAETATRRTDADAGILRRAFCLAKLGP
jgi:hypothetical protein